MVLLRWWFGKVLMYVQVFANIESFKVLTKRCVCILQYESVLSDCNQALSLEFHNVKALFRRAQAYKVRVVLY